MQGQFLVQIKTERRLPAADECSFSRFHNKLCVSWPSFSAYEANRSKSETRAWSSLLSPAMFSSSSINFLFSLREKKKENLCNKTEEQEEEEEEEGGHNSRQELKQRRGRRQNGNSRAFWLNGCAQLKQREQPPVVVVNCVLARLPRAVALAPMAAPSVAAGLVV